MTAPLFNVIPLVLHRIVSDGCQSNFEDVELSIFKRILDYCGDRFTTIDNGKLNPIPLAKSYLLTFDDGNSSDAEIALPLLTSMKRSAVFFLIADKVNKPGYLSRLQVGELVSAGMVIGSHSLTHQDMRNLSASKQREEFIASKNRIEDISGVQVSCFSFPYGKFDSSLVKVALECGYQSVFTSKHGIVRLPSVVLPRNSINGTMLWASVLRTLEAERLIRFLWLSEDIAKLSVMRLIGDDFYRIIREVLTGVQRK